MKNKINFLLIIAFVFCLSPILSNFALANNEYVSDEIVVKLKENVATVADQVSRVAQGFGAKVKRTDKAGDFTVLKLPATTDVQQALNYYNNKKLRPEVEYAEPNYIYEAKFIPNDTLFDEQWNFQTINMPQAWDYDTSAPLYGGDPSVVVAVIDTGVAYENYGNYVKAPDFTGSYPAFRAGYDFVNNDAHANDDQGHGTHVASTIAESTNNNLGTAGIAFNSTIMPVKVLDSTGFGTNDQVASGIIFAKNNGAKVINMSLGGPYSRIMDDAVTTAADAGVVIVAAAGNENQPVLDYPARFPQVISVGATRYHNNLRTSYSSYGQGLDLVAPGGQTDEGYFNGFYGWFSRGPFANLSDCLSANPGNTRYCSGDGIIQQSFSEFFLRNPITDPSSFTSWPINGTSMATPHVVGVSALLLAYGVPANNVRSIVDNSATDLGPSGYDIEYGNGLLNAANAFTYPTIKILSSYYVNNSNDKNITITGTNFAGLTTAAVGSTALKNVSVINENTITATVPKHLTPGIYDLTVDSNGKITTATNFINIVNNPPKNITNLRTLTTNGKVTFSWTNPKAWDFSKIRIVRKKKGFPTSVGDGRTVFNKNKTFFVDSGLSNRAYYYKIFAGDTSNSYSSGVPVVIIPQKKFLVSVPSNKISSVGDVDANGADEVILGTKKGEDPKIFITDRNGNVLFKKKGFLPFGLSARNCGINVASGDVNGDGADEIIASTGYPCKATIKVFDRNGNVKFNNKGFQPFKKANGATVASGDLNGDNIDEIIVGSEKNSSKIFTYKLSGNSFSKVFAIDGWNSLKNKSGVRVFSADVNYDGKDEIVASPIIGKKSIRIFNKNGKKVFKNVGWMPYANYTDNLRMTLGDVNSDGYDEILTAKFGNSVVNSWSLKMKSPRLINNYFLNANQFLVGRFF